MLVSTKPTVIGCDSGPEFISAEFTAWAKGQNIQIEYIQPSNPQQNAFLERCNKTIW